MKKLPAALGIAIAGLAVAMVSVVPMSSPNPICTAATPWDQPSDEFGPLDHPMDLALGDGFLYVADTENGAVRKYRRDGTLVARWDGFARPVDVAVAGDSVYVVEFIADRVSRLASDGSVIAQWGRRGTANGEFDAPSGVAVDDDGYVYVVDFYNHRIQKFTDAGEFVGKWGGKGRGSGKFRYPTDVAVGPEGLVVVADAYNHRVQTFTADGTFVAKWGGVGFGVSGKWPGWFRLAKAVAVGPRGNVYVADAFNNRVQTFTSDGDLIGEAGKSGPEAQQLKYPAGVAVDTNGDLYVSDFFRNRILKITCEAA